MAETADRRLEVFTMRISDDERAKLDVLAKSQKVKVAVVIRQAVNEWCTGKGLDVPFRDDEKGGAG